MSKRSPGAMILFAAPAAWLIEIGVGYALASERCFAGDRRLPFPSANWAWTQGALYALAILAALVALYAFLVSLRAFRQYIGAAASPAPVGSRIEFAALWGVAFSGGFGVATLLTGVGLLLLPQCGG